MGVVEITETYNSPVPAAKLFKAWIIDSPTLLPKIAPDHVKSVVVEGNNGGPGSIHHVTFADVVPIKFAKFKVDVQDENTLTYADTVLEGGELSQKVLKVTHETKFKPSPEGGCSATTVVKFDIKEGETLRDDELKNSIEGAFGLFKAVEAYCMAN